MWRKLLFFGTLYFLQGAALAYVVNFQKPMLVANGVSKEAVGLFTSALLIPFIAKILLGYLSDRYPIPGGRKGYMMLALVLFAVSYFLLSFIRPGEQFALYAITMFIASLGLAWFDTNADGLAVDVASTSEQASVQAAMIAGKSSGLILMSLAFGAVGEAGSIFRLIAALAVLVLVLVWFSPTFKREDRPREEWSLKDVWCARYLLFALFGVVYSIASFGTDGLLTLHLSEVRGAQAQDLGAFGASRGVGALLGALAFAGIARRIGARSAQILALTALGFGCLLPLTDSPFVLVAIAWGICWGLQETAFVTLAMRYAQGAWAATLFALAMIFSNLGTSIGEALAAPLVPQLGFVGVFAMFAGLAWISLAFVPRLYR